MADILKEIYNGTILPSDIYTSGAFTLATTNSTTQYVIKDINVSDSFIGTPVLEVNNTNLTGLKSSVSGSEIVDVSSTVKYRVSSSGGTNLRRFKFTFRGAGYITYDKTTFTINSSNVDAVVESVLAITGTVNGTIEFGKATDGSIFSVVWDTTTNNSIIIYKNALSINGTSSTIATLSMNAWCVFNNIDTYYYAQSSAPSTLNKYDINSGATATGTPGTIVTTAPTAHYMNNGLIVVSTVNTSSTGLTVLNPVANTILAFTGMTSIALTGANRYLCGYYNTTTDRYTFYRRLNTLLYKCTLNGSLGASYAGGFTQTTFAVPSLSSNTYVKCTDTTYSYALHGVSGMTQLVTIDTITGTSTTEDWIPYTTNTDTFIETAVTPSISAFTEGVKVRVTGIQATI
jgi:hypothetical protein